MNLKQFLDEARRDRPQVPQKLDPKDPKTPMLQKIGAAGDIGQKEMLQKVTGKSVSTPQQFRKVGKQVASAATGVEFGDRDDPIERALNIVRGPAQYQREKQRQAKNNRDKAAEKAYQQGVPEGEYESLPSTERMGRAVKAGKQAGGYDATAEVDSALKDARLTAEKPTLRDPIKVDGEEIYDRAYLRHGYQSSGEGLPDLKNKPDPKDENAVRDYLDDVDDFVDRLVGINADPDKNTGGKGATASPADGPSVDDMMNKGGGSDTKNRNPSARDLMNIQKDAEDKGVESGETYLTPEVREKQAKFRKALSTMDSEAIQELSFNTEVDDETLDKFISAYGGGGKFKEKLAAAFENRGSIGDKKRERAVYGGKLFDGEIPESVRPKRKGASGWELDPDAPEDVYDFAALKKEYPELFNQAMEQRTREVVRTYLKQGGRDAYAQHEGVRGIGDMDLEHIASLQADAEPGEEGGSGYDHPTNWVWASGELNKLRGATPLDQRTDKYVQNPADAEKITQDTIDTQKKTYDELISSMDADTKKRLQKELGKPGQKAFGLSQAALDGARGDVDERRASLVKNFGASEEQAKLMIPDAPTNPDKRVMDASTKLKDSERIPGKPFTTDPEGYKRDVKTKERDRLIYNDAMEKIGKLYPQLTRDQRRSTPEYLEMIAGLESLGASEVGTENKPLKPQEAPKMATPKARKGPAPDRNGIEAMLAANDAEDDDFEELSPDELRKRELARKTRKPANMVDGGGI